MSACGGLHCAGCASGAGVPVAAFAAVFGVAWVAEHLAEVLAVSAGCGVVAVVFVVAVMRWTDRREARFAAILAACREHQALPPPARPQVSAPAARPQLEAGGNHLHLHFDGADPAEVAAIIARMGQNRSTES